MGQRRLSVIAYCLDVIDNFHREKQGKGHTCKCFPSGYGVMSPGFYLFIYLSYLW